MTALVGLASSPGINVAQIDQDVQRTKSMAARNKLYDISLKAAQRQEEMDAAMAPLKAKQEQEALLAQTLPNDVNQIEAMMDAGDYSQAAGIAAEYQRFFPQAEQISAAIAAMPGLPEDQQKAVREELGQVFTGIRQTYAAQAQSATAPASVREWQFYNQLSPEDQTRYIDMKRNGWKIQETARGLEAIQSQTGDRRLLSPRSAEDEAAATTERTVTSAGERARADVEINTAEPRAVAQAEADRAAAAPEAIQSAEAQMRGIDNTLRVVDEAIGKANGFTTGWGSLLQYVPGTDARSLRSNIDTIKANLAFDRLQSMRDLSKTGGALGQVSERELRLLESAVDSLDQGLEDRELVENFNSIKRHYTNARAVLNQIIAVNQGRLSEDEAMQNIEPLALGAAGGETQSAYERWKQENRR